MNPDAQKLAALKEELRKDLEALERVEKLMAIKNGSLNWPDDRQLTLPVPSHPTETEGDDLESPVTSLRGKIDQVINADPSIRWTAQKVLSHLRATGFPLKAQKPIYSVGQSLQVLAERGRIRIVRRGVGSAPNIYRGKTTEQQTSSEAHSEGGDLITGSTITG